MHIILHCAVNFHCVSWSTFIKLEEETYFLKKSFAIWDPAVFFVLWHSISLNWLVHYFRLQRLFLRWFEHLEWAVLITRRWQINISLSFAIFILVRTEHQTGLLDSSRNISWRHRLFLWLFFCQQWCWCCCFMKRLNHLKPCRVIADSD